MGDFMDYNVVIVAEADFSDDPAFVYPFKADAIDDFRAAVGEAIAEWRYNNPNRDFLGAGCTVLVEKAAVFSRPTRAVQVSSTRRY